VCPSLCCGPGRCNSSPLRAVPHREVPGLPRDRRPGSARPWFIFLGCRVARRGSCGEAGMTAKTIARHARPLARRRWVPRPAESRLAGRWSRGVSQPGLASGRGGADPLAGRLPLPAGLFWVTGSEGRPPGVRWLPVSRGMKTQQRSARPTSVPGRSPPGGGMMRPAAWCARTASGAARACGPAIQRHRGTSHRPVGPVRTPVARRRAGSVPCGQRCPCGTRMCGVVGTSGGNGYACSRRWPPAATDGTRRHLALPAARPAASPAGASRSRHRAAAALTWDLRRG
jgi:hypothetical protein